MIERLQSFRAVCDGCQTRSEVYHAPQTGTVPLPKGWVRVPGVGSSNYRAATGERVLCPYCAMKRERG